MITNFTFPQIHLARRAVAPHSKKLVADKMLSHINRKMRSHFLHLIAAALCCLLAACASERTRPIKNTSRTFTAVVVDAGHGGRDSGAVRRYGPPEKIIALDVAQRVEKKLRESQLKTVMTRNSDVFIPLDTRVAIGNGQKNSVFVSIHFNDSRRRAIHGFETYYYSPASYDLAQRIQSKLLTLPRAVNRGVHPANYRVLRKAAYPSVLVECGFLSNRSEAQSARSSDYRDQLADKISEAIVEQRYGPGAYQGGAQSVVEQPSTANPQMSPPPKAPAIGSPRR
jgi:N-acetylmuramoyl-L-alanine amidase